MTGTTPASSAAQPSRDDLTPRIFRALYNDFDLLTIGVIHIVTPKGVPVFIGDSLGQIARQISDHETVPGHAIIRRPRLTISPPAWHRDRRRPCNRWTGSGPQRPAPSERARPAWSAHLTGCSASAAYAGLRRRMRRLRRRVRKPRPDRMDERANAAVAPQRRARRLPSR